MAEEVGLRVRNKDRILQIDGLYQNQEFVAVYNYTMSLKDNDILGYYALVYVPEGRVNPMLAVVSTDTGVYVKKMGPSTFRIYAGDMLNGNRTVRVYVFADPSNLAIGKYGLVVRSKRTGQIIYNSNNKYLRILGYTPVSLGINTSASGAYPGRTIAVIQSVRPYGRKTDTGGPPNQPIGLFGFFSGTIRMTDQSTFVIDHRSVASAVGPNVGNTLRTSPWGTYLTVDATGFG